MRSKSQRLHLDLHSPLNTQKITAEVCIKRHHSLSLDDSEEPPAKRTRMTVEVGVRGETPPRTSGFQDSDYQESTTPTFKESAGSDGWLSDDIDTTSSQSKQEEVTDKEAHTQKIQMSFYGEHRPLSPVDARSSKLSVGSPTKAAPLTLPADDSLSSILSKISDEKLLKDLASAVSTLTNKATSNSASSLRVPGVPPAVLDPVAAASSARQVPDYGANTPPPEDILPQARKHPPQPLPPLEKLPRVAGGPPFPQQIAAASNQFHQAPPPPDHNPNHRRDTSDYRDRERFANTPPPEFQPSFTYPPQQQPYQQQQYHNNYPPNREGFQQPPQPPHPPIPQQQQGPPHNYYESSNNYMPSQQPGHGTGYLQQQDPREHRQQDHTHYNDPRLRDQSHARGRGYPPRQGEGDYPSYRGNSGGSRRDDHEHDDYHMTKGQGEDRKYPADWYRN